MPTDLKRELGLSETFAIAVGAMVGSGIFILPGIAFVISDSAAVLAFVFAAVLTLPAALAISEMSTAIPQDGGPYLYVERSMGPLLGTVAGIGTWLMLTLKSALALVGGVPYLAYVDESLAGFVTVIAVSLAIFFTVINLVSAEGSGKLQFAIVGVLVAILAYFVVAGVPAISFDRTAGAFDPTSGGILAATAIVFISYAGLTKIGAVAEEVEDPGRNLPLAVIGALAFVTLVYAVVVYVTIGVLDIPAAIEAEGARALSDDGEGPIIALAAEEVIGTVGALAIVVAALIALASTANAGLLAASRFPLAMARDGVLPDTLEEVSERFSTPVYAVALTGLVLTGLTFLPIQEVAAFGSAFQILVFILLNVALVGFREGAIEEYDPAFVTPLYPWTPLFGILSGIVVLSYMSPLAIVGALGIAGLAVVWYFGYVRYYQGGIDREGAARAGVRESVSVNAVDRTRELFESDAEFDVLVAATDNTDEDARRDMLRIAADLGRLRTTVVSMVEFVDIPHRVFAESHAEVTEREPPDWIADESGDRPAWLPDGSGTQAGRTDEGVSESLSVAYDTAIEYREVDSEDHKRAIVDVATYEGYDLIVLERNREELHHRVFGGEIQWLLDNAPCDVLLVEDRGFDEIEEIAVVASRGPYDPLKLLVADAVAEETGAEINLLQAIPTDSADTKRRTVERYHTELMRLTTVPTRSTVVEADDEVAGLARFAASADLLVTGVDRAGLSGRLLGRPGNRLVESVDCTAVMVQTHDDSTPRNVVGRLLMDYLFS